ncbi:MAG: hypothetical protein ABSH46_08590 [Bryobacteraceae bacterium]|jgi:hypothetical protein
MKILCWTAALALALSAADGQPLSPKDFDQAKKMTKGTWYLRVDAPCLYEAGGRYNSAAFLAREGVVIASPSAVNTELDGAAQVPSGAAWVLRPNDPIGRGALYYSKEGNRDLEFDFDGLGLPPKERESIVAFRDIHSFEDFKTAFERAFSRVPLQDAHAEWSEEVSVAVKEHRLIEGMDRRQVHAVIGLPEKVEIDKSEGRLVEKWYSRPVEGTVTGAPAPPRNRGQEKRADGIVPDNGPRQGPTRFPPVIVFLNGKLTTAEALYAPAEREALIHFASLPSANKK